MYKYIQVLIKTRLALGRAATAQEDGSPLPQKRSQLAFSVRVSANKQEVTPTTVTGIKHIKNLPGKPALPISRDACAMGDTREYEPNL